MLLQSRLSAGLPPVALQSMYSLPGKGQKGRQGMLLARLQDTALARELLVVSVHLKAKAGAENDELRERQVGGHTFCITRPASYMCSPQESRVTKMASTQPCGMTQRACAGAAALERCGDCSRRCAAPHHCLW